MADSKEFPEWKWEGYKKPPEKVIPLHEVPTSQKIAKLFPQPARKEPKHFTRTATEDFLWNAEYADREGAWTWGEERNWTEVLWDEVLHPFLKDCGTKTWGTLERETAGGSQRHKSYELSVICKEAQRRLRDISLDDLPHIFRLRLNNKQRFYGYCVSGCWYALWWDAEHMICPSPRK